MAFLDPLGYTPCGQSLQRGEVDMDRLLAIASVGVLLLGCSMDVDVSQLKFAPEDSAQQPDVDEYGPIDCTKYIHCIVGHAGAPGDPNTCLNAVTDASMEEAHALEACRVKRCADFEFQSGPEKAGLAIRCLLENCTDETVACTAGHGEATCLSYAVKWQSQVAGTTQCALNPAELCLVNYLVPVRSVDRDDVVKLIQCVAELPPGAVEELPKCLALCD